MRTLTALALLFIASLSHAAQYAITADAPASRMDGTPLTGQISYTVTADSAIVCNGLPCVANLDSASEFCVSATEDSGDSVQTGPASCVTLIAPPAAPQNIKITVTVEVK